jgi:predicted protein tyrosine phosphatase
MKTLEVRSRQNAQIFESPLPWGCVSIATVSGTWPSIVSENRVGLLQESFCDVDDGEGRISEEQAQRILQFFKSNWDSVDTFLIHCEMGYSRSPAVAAAIAKLSTGDDFHWFRSYRPNMLVYRTLLETAYKMGIERDFK